MWVRQCHKPSSHHNFYRWYGYHSQSWVVYGIVLLATSLSIRQPKSSTHNPVQELGETILTFLFQQNWRGYQFEYLHQYLYIYIYAPGPATPPLPPPPHGMGPHIEIFPLPPCGVVGVWYCPPPPLWCGGGVVWYVGYVWCVWSVWYGMFGKYGCMVGMVCMACMFAIVCMVGVAIMLHMYGICGMYDRYDRYGMHGIIGMYGRYGIC